MAYVLALGDCNTSGDVKFKDNAYPERFAKCISHDLKNCGYTMSTTREMQHFFHDFYTSDTHIILIQYGLVDSWKTFKYAPYVLYYPDYFFRKILRKIVKKYKKIAKSFKLNALFGAKNVVDVKEYENNIEKIILAAADSIVILIDTVPNHQLFRNSAIEEYNQVLDRLAEQYENCYKLDIYKDFLDNMDTYYLDETHINNIGYDVITEKILNLYKMIEK